MSGHRCKTDWAFLIAGGYPSFVKAIQATTVFLKWLNKCGYVAVRVYRVNSGAGVFFFFFFFFTVLSGSGFLAAAFFLFFFFLAAVQSGQAFNKPPAGA